MQLCGIISRAARRVTIEERRAVAQIELRRVQRGPRGVAALVRIARLLMRRQEPDALGRRPRARTSPEGRNSVMPTIEVARLQDGIDGIFSVFRGTSLAEILIRPGDLPEPRSWLTHPSKLTPPPTDSIVPPRPCTYDRPV
jgi:hypothetical protein